MLVVVIRGGYVVECRKIALTRDFSTLRSSGLSCFEVGCVAAMHCSLFRHWPTFVVELS